MEPLSLLEDFLYDSLNHKRVITIRVSDEQVWNGVILDFNEEITLFLNIDEHGNQDGTIALPTMHISSIDQDDDDVKSIQYLFDLNKYQINNPYSLPDTNEFDFDSEDFDEDDFDEEAYYASWVFKFVKQNDLSNTLVSIELDEYSSTGFIAGIDDTYIKIQKVDELGFLDGYQLDTLSNINCIYLQDQDCNTRLKLHNWRTSK